MADEPNDRLKKLENALDPAITKFMPKRLTDPLRIDEPPPPSLPPPLSQLVEMLRAHAKGVNDVANEIEQHSDKSYDSLKASLDHLMDTVKRIK